MKTILLFYALLQVGFFPMDHDVPLAIFKIYEDDQMVKYDIAFDKVDFCQSSQVNVDQVNQVFLEEYLNDNFTLTVDQKSIRFIIKDVHIDKEHIRITGQFDIGNSLFQTIGIKNTCLIDISGHSNIIQLELKDRIRDFRMHKERTMIAVKY